MRKEIINFNIHNMWVPIDCINISTGRRALCTRWIFWIKTGSDKSLTYKARLRVKGYEQIPEVAFMQTFSPVAGDTTIWTVLATAMYQKWVCEAIDVVEAFLNADLDDEVLVEVQEGFGGGEVNQLKQIFKLQKAVYSIVQAPEPSLLLNL